MPKMRGFVRARNSWQATCPPRAGPGGGGTYARPSKNPPGAPLTLHQFLARRKRHMSAIFFLGPKAFGSGNMPKCKLGTPTLPTQHVQTRGGWGEVLG